MPATEIGLRPGFMVRISVPVRGGVSYSVRTIESETVAPDGTARAAWETTRIVEDRAEHDAATALRARIRNYLAGTLCRVGDLGTFLPEASAPEFDRRLTEAEGWAAEFNGSARTCRVRIGAVRGRIEADSEREVAAVRREISAMLQAVEAGVRAMDPVAIRKAATEAREAARVLSPRAASQVDAAIEEARKIAREAQARVKAGADRAAIVITEDRIQALRTARVAFLDVGDTLEPSPVVDPIRAARSVDLDTPSSLSTGPEAAPVRVREITTDDPDSVPVPPVTPDRSRSLDV